MSSPQKRPFKIWSKSHDFGHNFSRFERFVFATPCVPPSATYFSASRYSKSVAFSRVILRSTEYAYLSREAIEAFRKVISPHFRKKKNRKQKRPGKFYIRCYPHLPLMKKPAEVRMGGGKGSKLRTYVCPVRPGQLLFEISFRSATWATAILKRASRKLNFRVSVSTLLKFTIFYFSSMANIGNNSIIHVIDNSGVKRIKNIMIYKRHAGQPGDLGIASLHRVKPRRKLKKGHITRFLLIQSRRQLSRVSGSYLRSVAFRAIILKKQDFEPLANRLNGFFFLELRRYEEFRNSSLTVYLI